jgi:hypothetical protein
MILTDIKIAGAFNFRLRLGGAGRLLPAPWPTRWGHRPSTEEAPVILGLLYLRNTAAEPGDYRSRRRQPVISIVILLLSGWFLNHLQLATNVRRAISTYRLL